MHWQLTMLLKEKTIFVTGAGRGIGREILLVALREGAAVVAHTGRHPTFDTSGINTDKNKFLPLSGDLTQPGIVNELWGKALAWRGRIDALVNNAGIYAPSPIDPASDWQEGWRNNLFLNLEVPAAFSRLAIKHNQQSGEGIVVNIASRSSHRGDDAEHLAYGASKGGLLALTKGISRSYSTHRTLAYAVAPGWVRTDMAEAHIESVGEAVLTDPLPLKEITPPADVAETVVFLASGRARHATGSTIDITGADYVR